MNALKTAFQQNAHYNKDQRLLIDLIICFLTYIQKKGCQTGNILHDLICNFIVMNTPLPTTQHQQFIVLDKKLASGVYGSVYDSGMFEMVPIVTKRPLEFDTKNIQEIFVNVVIINSLLLEHPWLQHHLVPTVGIFLCSKGDCSIFDSESKSPSTIHLVQKKIKGKTLGKFIKANPKIVSLQWVKQCIIHILKALEMLEKSTYQLYHRDLHHDNIIVDDKTHLPYVIDFGISSFEIGPKSVSFCYEDEILYDGKRIKSASNDIKKLLMTFYYFGKKKIGDYAKKMIVRVFGELLVSETVKLSEMEDVCDFLNSGEIYEILNTRESLLKKKKVHVHAHNMAILCSITYSSFKEMIV